MVLGVALARGPVQVMRWAQARRSLAARQSRIQVSLLTMQSNFDGVEQGELGPGVGTFPAHDQPGPDRPGVDVDQAGDLDHLSPWPKPAVAINSLRPCLFLNQAQSVTDTVVDGVADGVLGVAGPGLFGEPV